MENEHALVLLDKIYRVHRPATLEGLSEILQYEYMKMNELNKIKK